MFSLFRQSFLKKLPVKRTPVFHAIPNMLPKWSFHTGPTTGEKETTDC